MPDPLFSATIGSDSSEHEERMVSDEIELVSDNEGLVVIGDPKAVEIFLVSEGLESRELDLSRLVPSLGSAAAAVDAASQIAANAGRWVKLSEKSADLLKSSRLMTGSESGLSRAIATTSKGRTTDILEIVTRGPGLLANPAILAGVGGLMSQMAMQRQMDEINEYLQVIARKVDEILRAQKDAVLADMIAVGLLIDDAMTVRAKVGRVSDVTWSKVQAAPMTIARTQAYALRQLDALAERIEKESHVDDLAKTAKEAQRNAQDWLVLLARCFQLQDAIGIVELDRVLDASPEEIDDHRLGLQTARQNRLELVSRSTMRLLARMDAAAELTNTEVVFNPINSRAVVTGINEAGADIVRFHAVVGVAGDRQALEAKRWLDAVGETRDKVLATGAEGMETALRVGSETIDRARTGAGKIAGDLSERLLRKRQAKGNAEAEE